ncbi:MAG: amidohydrolase family protein [Lentisphaerae bacterium]|nr:amidohydrolase family protein [Lentisphaerota bacterium]
MRATQEIPDLTSLRLFDSCVTMGRIVHSGLPSLTSANILAMLDRYGIAEALVHEHHARTVYPREHGNQRLLTEISGLERLHPVWVLEPPAQPGLAAARAAVSAMRSAGVRAARFPLNRAPLLAWLWEDLCAALEERRVPCFLDFGADSTRGSLRDDQANELRNLALAHPRLPLILSHVMGGLGLHYAVVPLIRRVSNLYLDITGILEFWRTVAYEVGAERVLFATGAPFTDPGILVSNVQYDARLTLPQKKLIAGDNLRRLLQSVQ